MGRGVATGSPVDEPIGGQSVSVLVVAHFLQQVDQLVFAEVEFPVEQGDAQAFGGQNEGVRKQAFEQEKYVMVSNITR